MPEPSAAGPRGGLIASMLVLLAALPVHAQPPLPEASREPLDALVRRVVTRQLAQHHIPGAVVVLIREGRVELMQGHGQADAGRGVAVDAERTLFRVASVGKLFVWTAVMQLVERGQLELDAEVDRWLEDELRPPPSFPGPLTLAHLMAHTGGFEVPERLWPAGPTPDSLRTYLEERRPTRVRPPGLLSAYSDYGTALAEHLVERVSGRPFEDYLQEEVWRPLGMHRSLFRRGVPERFAAEVARAHTFTSGRLHAQPLERVVVASTGSLLTTAPDMARFMLLHLRGGEVDGQRVLREDTLRRMHQRHFTHDTRLSGWAHGFMEFQLQGQRLIGHTGDAYLFSSLVALLPERGWGLFVSYNGLGEHNAAQGARMELLRVLLARDFPAPPPAPAPRPVLQPERFGGGYQTTWRTYDTAEASLGWRHELRIEARGDGTLVLHGGETTARRWVPVEPLLFRPAEPPDAPERLAFREDAQGHITHLFLENRPLEAYERVPWYDTRAATLGLFAACALLFGLTGVRGLRERTGPARVEALLAGVNLLVLAGVVLLVHPLVPFGAEDTPWLLGATRAGALLAGGLLPVAVLLRTRPGPGPRPAWSARSLSVGGLLAAGLFGAWLYHWHLMAGV
jgi:CubicO group peptidase (beta-lactamase class C family)